MRQNYWVPGVDGVSLGVDHTFFTSTGYTERNPRAVLKRSDGSVAREAPIHVAAHKGHAAVVKLLAGHASSDTAIVAEANEKLQQKGVGAGAGAAAG